MAAAVLHQQPAGHPSTFSALTLFESTLMNAGMLLDSMTLDDLCAALRLINSLHLQLVDIMQPSAADVQRRLVRAEHRLSEQPSPQSPAPPQQLTLKHEPQTSDRKRPLRHSKAAPAVDFSESKFRMVEANGDTGGSGSGSEFQSQKFPTLNIDDEDNDDVELINDLDATHRAGGGYSTILNSSGTDFVGSASGCWSGNIRNVLHEAYKKLRGSGPHLFDFSKPWEHSANQDAARRVMDLVRTDSGIEADDDAWKKLYQYYVRESKRVQCNRRTAARCNRMKAKLGRRQKAFESLLSNLSADELNQFRTVLSRDFTSSDEEDDGGASASGEPDDEQSNLRVRSLAWESDTVADIKRRLDETFYARFATVKQRAQLTRCLRCDGVESNRTPPAGAPSWAVRSASAGPAP